MPHHRVVCFRPDTRPVKLTLQGRSIFHVAPVNGRQLVALPDARLVGRTIFLHPIGDQVPTALYPPRAVGRSLKFVLFLEVDPGESAGGGSQQEQQAGGKTDLEVLVHGLVGRHQRDQPRRVFSSPPLHLQLHCHESVLPQAAKPPAHSDFHHYMRWAEQRIQILEGFSRILYPLLLLVFSGIDITVIREFPRPQPTQVES